MTNFKFSLESVLDFRKKNEEKEMENLSKAIRNLQFEEEYLYKLLHEKESYVFSVSGALNVAMLAHRESYLSLLSLRINEQKEKVQEKKEVVKRQRTLLAKVARDRKVIEKVREKKYDEYYKEMLKNEQNQMDEAGIISYSRIVE